MKSTAAKNETSPRYVIMDGRRMVMLEEAEYERLFGPDVDPLDEILLAQQVEDPINRVDQLLPWHVVLEVPAERLRA